MIVKPIDRAIFLDRDGVLSPDEFGYISDPALYHLYPYTGQALRILKALGFRIFVVTNQSGIARGYFGVEALESVLGHMKDLIAAEGVKLDGVYYSPYYKDGVVVPYNVQHEDRKPGIGMFKQALSQVTFNPQTSWMIGDRATDIEFGQNAGMKTILLLSGNGSKEFTEGVMPGVLKPNYVCANLLTAASMIRKR
ncbi:MAG: HAD family hydrolase, partial [Candidatus Cloacimonas sp.]|nr:HAD family hydrolase [Candidatus Cloacimonas sp.]